MMIRLSDDNVDDDDIDCRSLVVSTLITELGGYFPNMTRSVF